MSAEESPSLFTEVRVWLKDSLVAGLVATAPLLVVLWGLEKLVFSPEGILNLIKPYWNPVWTLPGTETSWVILETPGFGFLVSLSLVILIGASARILTRGVLGQAISRRVTGTLQKLPILGTLYSAVRQLLETVFSSRAQQFQRVVLVQFPRPGAYCLGFLTAQAWKGVEDVVGRGLVSVFVPTTPNPTSGFFVMFSEEEVTVLDMTVEEAFKAIMSSGIVTPERGGVLVGADLATITKTFDDLPAAPESGEEAEEDDGGSS